MFTGGITVLAAESSTPYEMFKDAVFHALTHENVTMESEFTLSINDDIREAYRASIFHGNGRQLSQSYENGRSTFDFQSEELRLRTHFVDSTGTQWYSVSTRGWDLTNVPVSISGIEADIRNTSEFRLAEIALDLVVGDLVNNFALNTRDDGTSRINWSVAEYEIPEIIEAFIDMMVEWNNRWSSDIAFYEELRAYYGDAAFDEMIREYYEYYDIIDILESLPITDAVINGARGYIDLDYDGNLIRFSLESTVTLVNIFGWDHTLEVVANAQFSDFGTTDSGSPVRGAVEMFTPEFMELHLERPDGIIYFTRNAVGTINRDSITTENPMWSSSFSDW